MDIVIEGKITKDEGVSDVIQTVIDLKNIPYPILRISSGDSEVQGRVAFSQGGYIVGGRLTNADDTGYDAIKKLFGVQDGNYAILDPGKQPPADCNQTLFIRAEKILGCLPDLPPKVDSLLDVTPEQLAASTKKAASLLNMQSVGQEEAAKFSSKTRTFDQKTWFFVQLAMWTLGILVVCAFIVIYGPSIFVSLSGRSAS